MPNNIEYCREYAPDMTCMVRALRVLYESGGDANAWPSGNDGQTQVRAETAATLPLAAHGGPHRRRKEARGRYAGGLHL